MHENNTGRNKWENNKTQHNQSIKMMKKNRFYRITSHLDLWAHFRRWRTRTKILQALVVSAAGAVDPHSADWPIRNREPWRIHPQQRSQRRCHHLVAPAVAAAAAQAFDWPAHQEGMDSYLPNRLKAYLQGCSFHRMKSTVDLSVDDRAVGRPSDRVLRDQWEASWSPAAAGIRAVRACSASAEVAAVAANASAWWPDRSAQDCCWWRGCPWCRTHGTECNRSIGSAVR